MNSLDSEGNPGTWTLEISSRLTLTTLTVGSVVAVLPALLSLTTVVLSDPIAASYPSLGNIETGFRLFDGPVKCTTGACVSSADSKILKRKAGTKMPLWPGDKKP